MSRGVKLVTLYGILPSTRNMFLDMVEMFYNHKNNADDSLYTRLEQMAEEEETAGRNLGIALLSGLAAALYPKKFMVCDSILTNSSLL